MREIPHNEYERIEELEIKFDLMIYEFVNLKYNLEA